ncbi:MAG: HlyD family efflux transporter periplasmic adaptor subunit [Planctomycetes bacterium]|nr:HlyD family efflux transporter periplasmic adaptor subunit [Planctomycetota bacterium]
MKSLQRLGHVRAPRATELGELRRERAQDVRSKERERLAGFLRRSAIAVGFATLVASAAWAWLERRAVVDGLVRAELQSEFAPALARVVAVRVKPGARVARGDELLRLEALSGAEERRQLELAVARAELELAVLAAGGRLDGVDALGEDERRAEAARRAVRTRDEWGAVRAELAALDGERAALALGEEAAARRRAAELDATERDIGLRAHALDVARAAAVDAARDRERYSGLRAQGLASERDHDFARGRERDAALARDAAEATLAVARAKADAALAAAELEGERACRTLEALDARRRATAARLAALEREQRAWDERERARAAFALDGADPRELGRLERELARNRLDSALARLAEFDAEHGTRIVRALADGVVDRVEVTAGSIVDEGDELVAVYDPSSLWIQGFADGDAVGRLRVGQAATIVRERNTTTSAAVLVSIGAAWVECPPELASAARTTAELRVPLRLECPPGDLRPFERVRVTLPLGPASTAP